MKQNKTLLNISFIAQRVDGGKISKKKYEKFEDELIELVEKHELMVGGGIAHVSEEENEELEKKELAGNEKLQEAISLLKRYDIQLQMERERRGKKPKMKPIQQDFYKFLKDIV